MLVIDFMYQLPDVDIFSLVSCLFIGVSIIAVYLVKWYVPYHVRSRDNTVIGTTSALVSVIYGVLAGFSALYLINNNSYTSDAVQREANAVANIYRDSKWLKQPEQQNIQQQVNRYLTHAIHIEWPKMALGMAVTDEGDVIIGRIAAQLQNAIRTDATGFLTQQSLLAEIHALYNARHQRINMSSAHLDPELWVVILIGTILTLCINYLFGLNFYLHIITVIAASLMTASTIFLLITLDKPFQGEFAITPDGLNALFRFIQQDTDHKINRASVERAPNVSWHLAERTRPLF